MLTKTQKEVSSEHFDLVAILRQGAEVWNVWRQEHPSEKIDLREANLSGANLHGANLHGANLTLARLSEANLTLARLSEANLRHANLFKTNLIFADLHQANLHHAVLSEANLSLADLSEANLSLADLGQANLINANLRQAILSEADLSETKLIFADLSEADLSGADLSGADLSGALFAHTRFQRTHLNRTFFCNVDLSTIIYGEKQHPNGSSVVDLDTITLSLRNGIPSYFPRFLRDCGVERALIERIVSLLPQATGGESRIPHNEPNSIQLRIVEEPLTSTNLAQILSSLTELHTKCWLIHQNRLEDLVTYSQTRDERYAAEANLVITRLSKNSPAEVAAAAIGALAKPITDVMESMATLKQKRDTLDLKNDELKLQIQTARKKAQQESAKAAQDLEIAEQRAALEQQKELIALEREQVTLQKEQLELDKQTFEFAKERAAFLIQLIRPDLSDSERGVAIATIVGNLLQLSQAKGLEIISSALLPSKAESPAPEQADDSAS